MTLVHVVIECPSNINRLQTLRHCVLVFFVLFLLLLFWSLVCLVAFDFLTTISHLAIVNVCVIIILSISNTQISILLLYLTVELMITMNG